jgi:ribonuclease-3
LFGFLPFFSKKSKSENELKLIKFLIKHFGHRPKNIELFQRALTHKSYSNIRSNTISNERLEFLGDAILDAIIAEYLFKRFPGEDEGYLTKIKAKIVNRKTLSDIGNTLKLSQFIRFNNSRNTNLATLEGNALEAIIGAIYLDSNYEKTKISVELYLFAKHVDFNQLLEQEIDFKSRMYIWAQKNRLSLDFEVISRLNEGENWTYTIQVRINQQAYGRGTGNSKKEAEQKAAKETLTLIGDI